MFRSTDTFKINDGYNWDYIPFKFVSGLNVLGYFNDEDGDGHNYLLAFDKTSKHLPEYLANGLPERNVIHLWSVKNGYWAVEPDDHNFLMSFFCRQNARLYLPCYTRWPCETRLVSWASENKEWGRYHELMNKHRGELAER